MGGTSGGRSIVTPYEAWCRFEKRTTEDTEGKKERASAAASGGRQPTDQSHERAALSGTPSAGSHRPFASSNSRRKPGAENGAPFAITRLTEPWHSAGEMRVTPQRVGTRWPPASGNGGGEWSDCG